MDRATYKKGESAGIEGVKYQIYILTILLLNSLKNLGDSWKLSTENEEIADYNKFDDAVLQLSEDSAILLQAKHKKKKNTKKDKTAVTLDQLMSTNSKQDTFSLPKYFFSYLKTREKFPEQTAVICTNARMDPKLNQYLISHKVLSDNFLHYGDEGCSYFTFNEKLVPELKESAKIYLDNNLKGKSFDETVITDDNLNEFLANLQFYSNYSAGMKTIEQLLFHLKRLDNLFSKTLPQDIYSKVAEWFEHPKGEYLTTTRAKALFCEINSDKFFEKLESYHVFFEHDQFLNVRLRTLTHIVVEGEYLLHAIRTRQLLKCGHKMLCICSDDDTNQQKQVVQAFALPRYRFLLVIWWKVINVEEICTELTEILVRDSEKKVVIIANNGFKFNGMELLETDVVNERVTMESLSKDTRQRLSKVKCIVFQGKEVNLGELFETSIDYEENIGAETLANLLRGDRITVGSEVVPLDEDTSNYYIHRAFKRCVTKDEENAIRNKEDFEKRREIFSEQDIYKVNDKVVAIIDTAGTGKTTVLTNLASNIKERNPHLWVIRIELCDHARALKEALAKMKNTVKVVQLLNSKSTTKLTGQLEKTVFSSTGKVVLMLDGVDEISPDYTDLVLNMLEECCNAPNFAKLFVTGRLHLTDMLEKKFQTKSFTFEPLTEASQKHFLTQYWLRNLELDDSYKERCSRYAQALMRRMSFWTKVVRKEETAFTAVPLQLKMLGDIFQESNHLEAFSDWEGCYQWVQGNGTEPRLPQDMNISTLYQMFVERKRNVFVNEKANPSGIPVGNEAFIDQFDKYVVHHRILALDVILEGSKCDFFSFYQKKGRNVQDNLLKIGIVQKLGKEYRFVHRTFAEYFFADSIVIDLGKNPLVEFQKFIFDEILTHPKFNVIRSFLDKLLDRHLDSLPSDIFQNYQSLSYNIDLTQSSRIMHQLAEEGCTAILQLLFKCIDFKIIRDKEADSVDILKIPFGNPLPKFISSNTLDVLRHLTRHNGVNVKIGVDTPLHRAVTKGHFGMVKFLVEQGANTNSRDKAQRTPIHLAMDYFEIMQFLVENQAKVKAKDERGYTVLENAIILDRPQIVRYLFDSILQNEGVDVNDDPIIPYTIAYLGRLEILKDLEKKYLDFESAVGNGETLIFGAARGEQLDTIEYLIYHGADFHAQDEEGNTVLHFIAKKGSLFSAAELLMELGMHINVNVKNFQGDTPLHLGVGSLVMVKLLVENGAEVNATNSKAETAICLAASGGFLESAKFLVSNEANVNVKDISGNTLLHLAALSGQLDAVQYFTDLGVDMNVKNNQGRTATHVAASKGHLRVVKFFIDNGADLHHKDKDGSNVLLVAALENQLNVVKFLVRRGEDVKFVREDGSTALHLAALRGHLDMIRLLAQLGVDVNIRDKKGRTALHLAIYFSYRLDTVEILVKLGADLSIKDNKQCMPLHLASLAQRWDTLKFLMDCMGYANGENYEGTKWYFINRRGQRIETSINRNHLVIFMGSQTAFHKAVTDGQLDTIKFFVELGVNVDIQTEAGNAALHIAASTGRLNIVQYLLECGANLMIRDIVGATVLHYAALSGLKSMVDYFLDCKLDINVTDNAGRTVLYYAIGKCDLDMIKFLIERGTDVNTRDANNWTVLHVCAMGDHLEEATLFTELGIDVDVRNNFGFTALHLATMQGSLNTFKFLVERADNVASREYRGRTTLHAVATGGRFEIAEILAGLVGVDIRDIDGYTALHLASAKGNLGIVTLLLDRGADVHTKNDQGRVALHFAALEGHFNVVRCLMDRGSDVNIKDKDDCTPLHLVAQETTTVKSHIYSFNMEKEKHYRFRSVAKFLVERGAKRDIKNSSGETPFSLADKTGNFYLLRSLK